MISLSDYKKSIASLFNDPDASEFDRETVSLIKSGKAFRAKRSTRNISEPSSGSNAAIRRMAGQR